MLNNSGKGVKERTGIICLEREANGNDFCERGVQMFGDNLHPLRAPGPEGPG